MPFVPPDFVVPTGLDTPRFRLEPLGPQHNERDHAAWTSSIDHIKSLPGWADRGWPPTDGMSLAGNLHDLERHARDFAERSGFTYSVLAGEKVVGCVYIYPDKDDPKITSISSCVSKDHADLDQPLWAAVSTWLAADWPFKTIQYAAR